MKTITQDDGRQVGRLMPDGTIVSDVPELIELNNAYQKEGVAVIISMPSEPGTETDAVKSLPATEVNVEGVLKYIGYIVT